MLLSRLELRNFRCFSSLDLSLEQTTVLVGANDTGKSTVLEAVGWLLDPYASRDWASASRPSESLESDTQAISIIGTLSDLGPDQHRDFGPLAQSGALRIGRSPATDDDNLWLVLNEEGLSAWVEMLDTGHLREYHEIDESEPLEAALRERGLVFAIDGETWADVDAVWAYVEPALTFLEGLQSGTAASSIALGGPRDSGWTPQAVVAPIIRRAIRQSVTGASSMVDEAAREALGWSGRYPRIGKALSEFEDAIDELMHAISDAHTQALDPASRIAGVGWDTSLEPSYVISTLVGSLGAIVRRDRDDVGGVDLESLGPGARRSLAIRALALFRDPQLWPTREDELSPPSLAVLLVEEPENGLHPAAQRDLAKTLREWATFGLQLVVVTHSPAFVNAADPSGIRLARRAGVPDLEKDGPCAVTPAANLAAIRDELGVLPSDVLLARRFVLVEGETEQVVLDSWARTLGYDLRADGVQLVPMGGYGASDRIAGFVTLAYEGADFVVVFDNGSDTVRVKRELDARFDSLVETIILSRTDLEGFYHPEAVSAWLRESANDAEGVDDDVVEVLGSTPSRVKGLDRLAKRALGRSFRKVDDGRAIARLTHESQIDSEIKGLLLRLGS